MATTATQETTKGTKGSAKAATKGQGKAKGTGAAPKGTAKPKTDGTFTGATPARQDGKLGPDPAALKAGKINPAREGKLLDAIRAGKGTTVPALVEATNLRTPTVRYGGISFGQADMIEVIRIGAEYNFVVKANDSHASAKAKELRNAVIVRRDAAAKATKAEAAESKK